MTAAQFFTASEAPHALQAYGGALQSRGWSLERKLHLYAAANVAWAEGGDGGQRLSAFGVIYNELRGYWQVFRNARSHWSHRQAFTRLSEMRQQAKPHLVKSLSLVPHDAELRQCVCHTVMSALPVKVNPSGGHSAMAVSKFLHFTWPTMFPIYDRAVIEQKVIRVFRSEWNAIKLNPIFEDVADPHALAYLKYLQWLAQLMAPHRKQVMRAFADWLKPHAQQVQRSLTGTICTYEATAAEMIIIGAMRVAMS